jgi:serine/threonine protein kinase
MPQRSARIIGGIYRIGQLISSSGMLTTYTAYNSNTDDVVGLFVIEFPPAFHPETMRPLLQTLDLRRSLQSAHVLRVHDWGVEDTRAYIATDPPRGVTLRHVLDTENIDMQRALDLSRQIAQGLSALHEKGLTGLDLRPQLITVDTVGLMDRAQIDDVGLRPLLNAPGYMNNQPGNDISALDPRYAPPEYINGGPVGAWSDVYQAGLLLFELITGRPPFVGRNPAETGVMQCTSPAPRMIQYQHDAPAGLQEVVDCALAKDPARRFANGGALLTALDAVRPPSSYSLMGQSGVGLTREMEQVDEEMTLRAARSEGNAGHAPAQPIPDMPLKGADGEEIYAYLTYEMEGAETQRFAITQKMVVVGRHDPKRKLEPDIDLSALDPTMTVSRQHARIRFERTFFYIEDLKSRNKTRLGELFLTPLKAELLQHGDMVRFGSVSMKFEIPGMPPPPVFKEKS